MDKSSELSFITELFSKNKNVNMDVFTILYQRVMYNLPVRLVFDQYGVSITFDGQTDNLLLYNGMFELDLAR